jgi:long-chain acyl-CoA synthetase
MEPATLTELFFNAIDRHGGADAALRSKRDGVWQGITHAELLTKVRAVQAALRGEGIKPGDRVAILSENRPEWAITDFACLSARCTDVPIYPTLPAHQIEYVLRDSGSRMVFCSNATQLDKILEIRDNLPELKAVIVFDGEASREDVRSFDEFEQEGRRIEGQWPDWKAEACSVTPDDLATLIYTSGTTGDPKGVMLSHGNLTSNVVSGLKVLDLGPGDSCLSFLPLSHVFERMVGHYTMFSAGATINYATSMDMVVQELGEVKPTILASVPRLYEKIYARVMFSAIHGCGLTRAFFEWAQATI